ncbi:hypothetical protein ACM41_05410 [Bradyrhizobium sp. CCBAU 21362]|uniref:hypothetical protein n=1 Tax=Bradyrhizobium sp. CCBAU 21362 TaxID=1325082 RepID=UPI0023062DAD|nr:hypothetical protein [Bradyrhizobium sp. CCBAU 21362]MDA9535730.1 hypothetical protein [Bradyrhizobium sp. CCBAU 21362]
MSSQTPRPLGIVNLERGVSPGESSPKSPLGGLLNPETFDFPVISEAVEGAWADVVVRGEPALEPAYIAAAKKLVQRGAAAISANCGFSIRHQAAVAAAVNVPVVLSSLLLLPSLLNQLPVSAKIAVLAYDSEHCGRDLLPVNDVDQARVVIGGLEGIKFWHDEHKRPAPPVDYSAINTDLSACIARLRSEHPGTAAILFECTAFPVIAPVMHRSTELPIYDTTNLCRLTMASV